MHVLTLIFVCLFSMNAFAAEPTHITGFDLRQTVEAVSRKFEVEPAAAKTRIISGKTARELVESAVETPWTGAYGSFLLIMVDESFSKHLQIVLPNGRELIVVLVHDGAGSPEGLGEQYIFDISQKTTTCWMGSMGENLDASHGCVCRKSCDQGACDPCNRPEWDENGTYGLDGKFLEELGYGLVDFF